MFSILAKAFCFIFILFFPSLLFSQDCSFQKLTASDAIAGQSLGTSVSIGTSYAIVGAPWDGNQQGAAYIYKYDGLAWHQTAKISGSVFSPYRAFGISVYIDDEFAIVGTYAQSKVYVFKREGEAWIEKKILTGDNPNNNPYDSDSFGWSVNMEGDLLIVGAYTEDTRGYNSGASYIFKREDNTGNNWNRQAKLVPSDLGYGNGFGYSVAISGNIAISTAIYDGTFDENTRGAVYIYERVGNNWVQQIKLKTDKHYHSGTFGMDADIYQNPQTGERTAVVGNDSKGVHIYKYINGSWQYVQFIEDPTKPLGYRFGFAVDIQGDRLLIGQPYASTAWLYKAKYGIFTQTQKLVAPDIHDNQQLGHSVGLSADGTKFILGAKADNEKGESAGAAYVMASANIQTPSPLCLSGNPVNLQATPAGGTWKGKGITNHASGEFSAALSGLGKHEIIYEYNNGICTLRDTTFIEVKDKPTVATITSLASLVLCGAEPVALHASYAQGQQYRWQYSQIKEGAYSEVLGENHYSTYYATKPGYYRVETLLQDCSSSYSEATHVKELGVEVSLTSATFCRGATTTLSITHTNGDTYRWQYSSDKNGTYWDAPGENTLATYQAGIAGFYKVISSLNGCSSSKIIEVKEAFIPVNISQPAPLCQGSSPVQLIGSPVNGIWSGEGVTNSGMFTPDEAGRYTLTYVVQNGGCQYAATTQVQVKVLPQAAITGETTRQFCPEAGTVLSINSQFGNTYSWEFAADAKSAFKEIQTGGNPTLATHAPGIYRTKVNQSSCIAYSQVVELIALRDSTNFPNVFTPNGDGVNDTFEPYIENASYYELEIYNRLGKKVYTSSGVTNQWDGKGYLTGVYYWLVRYNTVCNKEVKVLKGIVSILY